MQNFLSFHFSLFTFFRTFAAAFRVIAGRKIGELPVMLRRNDNNNRLIIKYKWI